MSHNIGMIKKKKPSHSLKPIAGWDPPESSIVGTAGGGFKGK